MSERADDLREKLDVERARADALEEERRSWAKYLASAQVALRLEFHDGSLKGGR